MLALVSYITGKVFSDTTVPVRAVCLVEELFDELTDIALRVTLLIHGLVDQALDVFLHFIVHFADDPLDTTLRHFKI